MAGRTKAWARGIIQAAVKEGVLMGMEVEELEQAMAAGMASAMRFLEEERRVLEEKKEELEAWRRLFPSLAPHLTKGSSEEGEIM